MKNTPHVRPLEATPIEDNGKHLVVLRDPGHFQPNVLTLSVPAYLLMTLMDGRRSPEQIQREFEREFDARVSGEDLRRLIGELDEHGLLFSKRFEAMRDEALRAFREDSRRRAAHAGTAYAKTPSALRKQIAAFYEAMEKDGNVVDHSSPPAGKTVKGVVVPHIDPRIGGRTAAYAFTALKETSPAPDLFILLGTAHQGGACLFSMTDKPFETPLGVAETDLDAARAIQAACPFDLKQDEFLHKHEHSIEFPLVFLQHLYGEKHSFQILPILAGSFQKFIEGDDSPSTDPDFAGFLAALRDAVAASGKTACYVAGADLSHMGLKFGDEEGVSEEFLEGTRSKDIHLLQHAAECDAEGLFQCVRADGDAQKICGLPPMYTMMRALDGGCTARLLDYDISIEEVTDSFVSFASMVFYG